MSLRAASASALLLEGRAALARGDLIAAYDAARYSLEAAESHDAAYLFVLALARMGDHVRAGREYRRLGLDHAQDVDSRALGARLLKDKAENLEGEAQAKAYLDASGSYHAIYKQTRDPFPGVNAASLALLGGDGRAARELAKELIAQMPAPTDFWSAATYSEALILLGRDEDAREIISVGLGFPGADAGARSTMRRQLGRLKRFGGLDLQNLVFDLLKPGAVIFYCGHMFVADVTTEDELATRVAQILEVNDVGCAYGALACGTDIVFAEQLLARGAELNVVLPFEAEAFRRYSVDVGGAKWGERFDRCLAAASTVHTVSTVDPIGDEQALRNSSWVAMGLTRLRAKELGAPSILLAVWDGLPARGDAGTAIDVGLWSGAGGAVSIIDAQGLDRALGRPTLPEPYAGPPRKIMSILFADVVGFAKLPEIDLPWFWEKVMGSIASVLDQNSDVVRSRNSWGDAVFAMIDGSAATAEIALSILDNLPAGESPASLRMGLHHGAVYSTDDPITKKPTFYGNEISKAARIEPVTPPGQVYVTQSFAAALEMERPDAYTCRYVGRTALAKDYGTIPMYRLTRI